MAAFTDYKALDFSGLDKGIERLGNAWREEKSNAAILDFIEKQYGQKQLGSTLANLSEDYGKGETAPRPAPVQSGPLPKVGVQVAENEGDTQRLEREMEAGQGAFASRGRASLIANESSGNFQAENNEVGAGGQRGHFGRAQFGQARLAEAAAAGAIPQGTNPQAFMQSPELQQRAEQWHFADIDNFIRQKGYDKAIGQATIGGFPITRDGMVAVAHLGGKGGLEKFIETGGSYNPADANGTRLSDYFTRHSGAAPQQGQQGGVQMAQAQGGPQADMPAPGAAEAQGFAIPGGGQAVPVTRQNIDVQALKGLIQAGGAARQLGLQLFQQAQTGKNFGFMQLQDGSVGRYSARDGTFERVIGPTKTQQPITVGEGQSLVDPNGRVVYEGKPKRDPNAEAYETRRREAARIGLKEGDPRYDSFVLTGKMPREDSQPLTATDKKAILEADEGVLAGETVLKALGDAKKLSPQALGGWGAQGKAAIANNLPDWLVPDALIGSPQQGQSTAELDNVVTTNALSQLKSLFGAAPTEGERKILMDIQGAVGQPDAVRQRIFDRAIQMAEQRLAFNRQRAQEMRGGNYYKPPGQPRQAPAAPEQRKPASMEGARQAPDGNTYVPDPNRPGKWLMVQP